MVLVSVPAASSAYDKPLFIFFDFTREELRRFKETKKIIELDCNSCGTNRCFLCTLENPVMVSLAEYTEIPVDAKTAGILLMQQERSSLDDIAGAVMRELEEEKRKDKPDIKPLYDWPSSAYRSKLRPHSSEIQAGLPRPLAGLPGPPKPLIALPDQVYKEYAEEEEDY